MSAGCWRRSSVPPHLAGAVEDLVPQLRLGLLHGPEALLDGGAQPAADGGDRLSGLGRDGVRQPGLRSAERAGERECKPQAQPDAGGEAEDPPHSSSPFFLRFPRRVLTPTPAPLRNARPLMIGLAVAADTSLATFETLEAAVSAAAMMPSTRSISTLSVVTVVRTSSSRGTVSLRRSFIIAWASVRIAVIFVSTRARKATSATNPSAAISAAACPHVTGISLPRPA